jgi:hypothetical protein
MKKAPSKLPRFLFKYFWDVDAGKINPQKQSVYVLERLMDKGDLKALKWVLKYFSKKDLRRVFLNSRNISKFSRPLWALFLKTNSLEEVCLQQEFLNKPKTAWPY